MNHSEVIQMYFLAFLGCFLLLGSGIGPLKGYRGKKLFAVGLICFALTRIAFFAPPLPKWHGAHDVGETLCILFAVAGLLGPWIDWRDHKAAERAKATK